MFADKPTKWERTFSIYLWAQAAERDISEI